MKRILCSAMICALLISQTAFAQDATGVPSVNQDRLTRKAVVVVETMNGAYSPVTIMIYGDIDATELCDITITSADADGRAEAEFMLSDSTARYFVRSNESMEMSEVDIYSSTDINNALSAFTSASDEEKMKNFFEEVINRGNFEGSQSDALGFEISESLKNKDALYKKLSKISTSVKTIGEAQMAYDDAIITEVFAQCDTDAFDNEIKKYCESLKFDNSEVYKLYLTLDSSAKSKACELIQKETFLNRDELLNIIEKAVVTAAVLCSDYGETVRDITEKYYKYLGITLNDYNGLSEYKKTQVMYELAAKPKDSISRISEFKRMFEEITDAAVRSTGNGSGTGGGGIGSSGNGRSTAISGNYGENVKNSEPETTVMAFVDMTDYDWAKDAVESLASKGIVNGKKDYFFFPGDNVSRAEFVKMTVGAFGITGAADISFDDVLSDDWSYPYIAAAAENNIIFGIDEKTFGKDMTITRQDMAVILFRAVEKKLGKKLISNVNPGIRDFDKIADYAKAAVKNMSGFGIIRGMEDGSFLPDVYANRAEAAVMIYRAMNYIGDTYK